jgi:hypothetical protein
MGIILWLIIGWKPRSITGSLIVAFVGSLLLIGIHRALFGAHRARA